MPLVATSRDQLSELLLGYSKFESETGVGYHFARVTVHAASDTLVPAIGTPITWDAIDDRFEILADTNTPATEATDLPNDAPMAITVGSLEGNGFNKADVTVTAAGVEMTVLFRGPAAISQDGIVYPAGVLAATQAVFETQLEKQGIAVKADAENVVPSFITA